MRLDEVCIIISSLPGIARRGTLSSPQIVWKRTLISTESLKQEQPPPIFHLRPFQNPAKLRLNRKRLPPNDVALFKIPWPQIPLSDSPKHHHLPQQQPQPNSHLPTFAKTNNNNTNTINNIIIKTSYTHSQTCLSSRPSRSRLLAAAPLWLLRLRSVSAFSPRARMRRRRRAVGRLRRRWRV